MKGKWNHPAHLVYSLAGLYVILFLVLYYYVFSRFAGVLWLNIAAHLLVWIPFGLLGPMLHSWLHALPRVILYGLLAALVAELPNLMTQVGLYTLLVSAGAVVCAGLGAAIGFLLWKWLIPRDLKFNRSVALDF